MFARVHDPVILGDDGGQVHKENKYKVTRALAWRDKTFYGGWRRAKHVQLDPDRVMTTAVGVDPEQALLITSHDGLVFPSVQGLNRERQAALRKAEANHALRPLAADPTTGQTLLPAAGQEAHYAEFQRVFSELRELCDDGPLRSLCEQRLRILENKWRVYRELNAENEDNQNLTMGGGDVAHASKVDVRRLGTSMSSKRLINFIQEKLKSSGDEQLDVRRNSGRKLEQNEVFGIKTASAPLTRKEAKRTDTASLRGIVQDFIAPGQEKGVAPTPLLSAEGLSLMPSYTHYSRKRLDVFNKKQPLRGRSDHSLQLLQHFLKYQWGDQGRYLAEILRPVIEQGTTTEKKVLSIPRSPSDPQAGADPFVQVNKVTVNFLDLEVTVHGLRNGEIEFIADWFSRHKLCAPNLSLSLRVVQRHYKEKDDSNTFDDVLVNIFTPLWEAVIHPKENAKVALMLANISGITVAFDDSAHHQTLPAKFQHPSEFGFGQAKKLPPDAYFVFFVWSNVQVLNAAIERHGNDLRHRLGFKPFQFNVHVDPKSPRSLDQLVTAYLLADLTHGGVWSLHTTPLIRYCYYLSSIPVCVSPTNHNGTNIPFKDNPLKEFIHEGLNVFLASGDPLHYHPNSDDPLGDEYHTASKNWQLAPSDLTEMCLRSVMMKRNHCNLTTEGDIVRAIGAVGARVAPENNAVLTQVLERGNGAAGTAGADSGFGGGFGDVDWTKNVFAQTQVPTGRLLYRQSCLHEELALINSPASIAFTSTQALTGKTVPPLFQRVKFISGKSVLATGTYKVLDPTVQFPRLIIQGPKSRNSEFHSGASRNLLRACELREKYQALQRESMGKNQMGVTTTTNQIARDPTEKRLLCKAGVYCVSSDRPQSNFVVPTLEEYSRDYYFIKEFVSHHAEVNLFSQRRLNILGLKYDIHCNMTNSDEPTSNLERRQIGDTYRCVKVDTHVHMASGMTAESLLQFIRKKVRFHGDDVVKLSKSGNPVTLRHMFANELKIDVEQLSVAALDVQAAGWSTFNRFDKFNSKYNPLGISDLRTLFLKTENYMGGRYFAELIKETLAAQERQGGGGSSASDGESPTFSSKDSSTCFSEFRLSIYGRNKREWSKLALWFTTHGMSSHTNTWMVQIPRLFHIYSQANMLESFQEFITNLFEPLWSVSIDPSSDPLLSHFLNFVSGFDSVDNESSLESDPATTLPTNWSTPNGYRGKNPPYSYYTYFLWANICSLNQFRHSRGLSTFDWRPHCGESGDPDHLIDGFLTSNNINHGIQLIHRPSLQYLYYIEQIGLGICPLSNAGLFVKYSRNPFPVFFRRGLNVTLTTDGPLQFHHTRDPLIEEYGTAAKYWKLSPSDVCEIAKLSVLQCGFRQERKEYWLGKLFFLRSSAGNNVQLSHLPNSRVAFRYEVFHDELSYLERRAGFSVTRRAMPTVEDEELAIIQISGKTRKQLLEEVMLVGKL